MRHLDSNVFVDYSRGRDPRLVLRFEQALRIQLAMSVIVVGELIVGADKTRDPAVLEEVRFRTKGIRKVLVSEEIAEIYADLRASLERLGAKMDANDLWIAATALAEDAILVTADEAFSRVPGLRTENWRLG